MDLKHDGPPSPLDREIAEVFEMAALMCPTDRLDSEFVAAAFKDLIRARGSRAVFPDPPVQQAARDLTLYFISRVREEASDALFPMDVTVRKVDEVFLDVDGRIEPIMLFEIRDKNGLPCFYTKKGGIESVERGAVGVVVQGNSEGSPPFFLEQIVSQSAFHALVENANARAYGEEADPSSLLTRVKDVILKAAAQVDSALPNDARFQFRGWRRIEGSDTFSVQGHVDTAPLGIDRLVEFEAQISWMESGEIKVLAASLDDWDDD